MKINKLFLASFVLLFSICLSLSVSAEPSDNKLKTLSESDRNKLLESYLNFFQTNTSEEAVLSSGFHFCNIARPNALADKGCQNCWSLFGDGAGMTDCELRLGAGVVYKKYCNETEENKRRCQ